jgi:hypothetical protein
MTKETDILKLYEKILKHSPYSKANDVVRIEANTYPSQSVEQYLIKSTSSDETLLNAIMIPTGIQTSQYLLNLNFEGVTNVNNINKWLGKIHFNHVVDIINSYALTGLSVGLIKDISYPAKISLSWFYQHQEVYQSFGAYYHSIYPDYNKRVAKVSFIDLTTGLETRPLKLTANLELLIVDEVLTPTVVLSVPFVKTKNRQELRININEPLDLAVYTSLFKNEFQSLLDAKVKKTKKK